MLHVPLYLALAPLDRVALLLHESDLQSAKLALENPPPTVNHMFIEGVWGEAQIAVKTVHRLHEAILTVLLK